MKNKRALRMIKGLKLDWTDNRPEVHQSIASFKINITHRNAVWRPLAYEMFRQHVDYIAVQTPFLWSVTAETFFIYPNGSQRTRITELTAYTRLNELNDFLLQELKEDKGIGNFFSHVKFTVECLDYKPKKEQAA